MATATHTTHYNWVQPALGGDPVTWGSELNTSLGAIDGQVWTNDQKVTAIQGYLTPHQIVISRTGATGYSSILLTNADTGNTPRWQIYSGGSAESGGNAGSDITIQAFNDAGAYLGWAMAFNRATQRVQIAQNPVGANDIAHKGYVDAQDASVLSQANAYTNTVGNAVGAPVGAIVMWATGSKVPVGWTWCLGYHFKYTDYPVLFNVLGGTWFWDGTNFGIPNIGGRVVTCYDGGGWSMGRIDGEYYHQLSIAEMPGHDHGYSQTPHGHTASQDDHVHYDSGHVHYDSGHGHGVNDPGHDHGYAFHTVYPSAGINSGANVGNLGQTTRDGTGISIQAGYASISTSYASIGYANYKGVYIGNGYANISFSGQGGWAAHNNMQPSICLGYIIRCY